MPKFRKKPVIIEAVQFDGVNDPPGVYRDAAEPKRPYVVTAHNQVVYVEPGDWIVPEPNPNEIEYTVARYYPVKPDIFEDTYDLVEEP